MIGSLIGAAVGIGTSIYGGIKSAAANRRRKADIEAQRAENKAWYDRRYNEDATQRADAQRVLTRTRDIIKERNKAAAGTRAVMGGTEESVAATKAANAEALANAASAIAANGDARKDRIEEQYQANDRELRSKLQGIDADQANNIGSAVKDAGAAAVKIAGLNFDKPQDSTATAATAAADSASTIANAAPGANTSDNIVDSPLDDPANTDWFLGNN